jgi:hypothetical protein
VGQLHLVKLTHYQTVDLVEVALPVEFRRQTLESITVKDTGRLVFQRAILWAVTVR